MGETFSDRLIRAVTAKKSHLLVGLDPYPERLPPHLVEEAGPGLAGLGRAIAAFNRGIIDAVADIAPAVKPQLAFYEAAGLPGMQAYLDTLAYAREKGLLVIADGKRNDISSTAAAYANAHLGRTELGGRSLPVFEADALTVTPYLGGDGIEPFVAQAEKYGKGVFVLVKTSNPSSAQLQDLGVSTTAGPMPLYEAVASLVEGWGSRLVGRDGYSSVGAVVGATFPDVAARLRALMPRTYFLVPGFGAQGGRLAQAANFFNSDGLGALIASSRSVIYAYQDQGADGRDYAARARQAALGMKREVDRALERAGSSAW